MLSFSCRLTLDDLQSRTCAVGRLENPDATDISDTSAIMSIRLNLLLTTLIYPAIRPGDRLGLQTHSVPVLQDDVSVLCLPPAFAAVPQYLVHTLGVLRSTMPSADFRYAMGSPCGSLSPRWTRNGSPGVIPATFDARLSDLPRYAKQRIEDFAVCCQLVPSYPSLIRLLFVSPHLCLRLPSRLALPLPPCPRLAFASVGAGPRL